MPVSGSTTNHRSPFAHASGGLSAASKKILFRPSTVSMMVPMSPARSGMSTPCTVTLAAADGGEGRLLVSTAVKRYQRVDPTGGRVMMSPVRLRGWPTRTHGPESDSASSANTYERCAGAGPEVREPFHRTDTDPTLLARMGAVG